MNYIAQIFSKHKKIYKALSSIYRIFFNPFILLSPIKLFKKIKYNLEKDLNYNTKLLIDHDFDVEKIKLQLNNYNLDYYDYHKSWHYHIFSGLSQKYKKIKILEIGTHNGNFASFLSQIFPDSKITSCDLPKDNNEFVSTYGREDPLEREKFLKKRKNNLDKINIQFLELDSTYLLEHFGKNYFDLIWIDGDHLNPQVTIDLLQSTILLKEGGLMLCDDVMKIKYKGKYTSGESFETLEMLGKKNIISNKYFIKRISRQNSFIKSFISISKKSTF